jgi:hypothetical protein
MNRAFAFFAATSVAALLAGCNNNNGTSVPESSSPLSGNETVTLNGALNGTARGISLTNVSVSEESGARGTLSGPPTDGPITATVGLDENRDAAAVGIAAPFLGLDRTLDDTNATVSEGTVTNFLPPPNNLDVITGTATDDSFSVQMVTGPTGTPFEYQTYGRWVLDTGEASFDMAVFSAGFETLMSGVPTSGTLDYAGTVDGRVIYPNGPIYETVANFNASVDFGQAQYFTFATTETMRITGSTASIDNRFNLNGGGNLNGTSMIGSIASTTNPDFLPIGTVNAQLYGPAANEIGGTFAVSSRPRQPSNPLTYIGSFGGATVSTD